MRTTEDSFRLNQRYRISVSKPPIPQKVQNNNLLCKFYKFSCAKCSLYNALLQNKKGHYNLKQIKATKLACYDRK